MEITTYMTTRNMLEDDWEQVSHLDTRAFNVYFQKTGSELLTTHRTRQNLCANLAMNPTGCFVSADSESLNGYIFSRAWGKIGWFGTFGLDPAVHGQGLGQQLLRLAVDNLQQAGCTTIGLETMSDAPSNIGLYTGFGFNPLHPTLILTQPAAAAPVALPCAPLSQLNEGQALPLISSISQSARPELDCAREAHNAREFGWGETLLLGWPQPWGFAIIRTIAIRGTNPAPVCEVCALALQPAARGRLDEVLQLLRNYAFEKQVSQLVLPVNTVDSAALQVVISHGFRVDRAVLRFVYGGSYPPPAGLEFCRWAM